MTNMEPIKGYGSIRKLKKALRVGLLDDKMSVLYDRESNAKDVVKHINTINRIAYMADYNCKNYIKLTFNDNYYNGKED